MKKTNVTKYLKVLKKLRLIDDTLARMAFTNEAVEFLLQTIFNDSTIHLATMETNKHLDNPGSRSIIMDILAKDINNVLFNLEMQKYKEGSVYERADYHMCMLTVKYSKPQCEWIDLAKAFVIFLVVSDTFKMSESVYHADAVLRESIQLDKHGHVLFECLNKNKGIVYVNVKAAQNEDTDLGRVCHDLMCANPEDMYYDVFRECVSRVKCVDGGISDMCQYMDELIEERTKEIAKNMLKDNLSLDLVAKYSELPKDEVFKLQSELALN